MNKTPGTENDPSGIKKCTHTLKKQPIFSPKKGAWYQKMNRWRVQPGTENEPLIKLPRGRGVFCINQGGIRHGEV